MSKKLWLLIASVLLLSIQILSVIIYIYSFIPIHWDQTFLTGLEPTRDSMFYIIFLGLTSGLMALGVIWLLPQLDSRARWRQLQLWLSLEALWVFLIVFCFFKWTTYRYPFWNILPYENGGWLRTFFIAVLGLAALSKIFFPEIERFWPKVTNLAARQVAVSKGMATALSAMFLVAVALLLYIPHPEDVAALSLAWDQFNHLDPVTGWFIAHGWYLSYPQIIELLAAAAVLYIVGLFCFIRVWLGSMFLAALGALLVVKLGLFYYGSTPCIWIYPGNTFLAQWWDIFLLFGLWWVWRKYTSRFTAVAIAAGVVLVAGWINGQGYLAAFGLDNQPLMAPLRVRQFFPYFMGFFVPVFYVFNILVLWGQKRADNRFSIALCVYGLMIFINYIEHPLVGSYGTFMVPAILVALRWIKQGVRSLPLAAQRGVYAGLVLLAAGALLTNRLMLIYPNCFFQDRNRFSRERLLDQNFDNVLVPSASLIGQLTKPNQKVVLLSNFEAALLIQVRRQPVFRDAPVMYSGLTQPAGLRLLTRRQGLDLIRQMEEENAFYAFVDGRLWALPPDILPGGLKAVLGWVRNHYREDRRQGFLVALHRGP